MYLVSACLCGEPCRYDGKPYTVERLAKLREQGLALAVCPELEGGLAAPRSPCELREGRVFTREGQDQTAAFEAGAARTLELARKHCIRTAVLKENSPSCGSAMIYDGTFSGRRIPGRGVTAALLHAAGIRLLSELTLAELEEP